MIQQTNIIKAELIGTTVTIIKSKNKTLEGVYGKVVDETKYTLTIVSDNKKKKVLKKACTFEVKTKENTRTINGEFIERRPEERIKTK